jgi:hypothetical protein
MAGKTKNRATKIRARLENQKDRLPAAPARDGRRFGFGLGRRLNTRRFMGGLHRGHGGGDDSIAGGVRVILPNPQRVHQDDEAREQQMSPAARLAYHQTYSQPIMDELKGWLQQQCDDRLVEPNSSLGKAMAYLQRHWTTLTRFLSIPGAPLDNNLVERALKLFIRQRKNSLFFRTEHSAYIASVMTSLIATCLYAGVNALDYLVALQEHRREVVADPASCLSNPLNTIYFLLVMIHYLD